MTTPAKWKPQAAETDDVVTRAQALYTAALESVATTVDREAVRVAVGGVLFNVTNFPERAQSRILGQNMGPLIAKVTDAVLTKWEGRTEAEVRADERERIAREVEAQEHTREQADNLVRSGFSVQFADGFDQAIETAARIAREGGRTDG